MHYMNSVLDRESYMEACLLESTKLLICKSE